MRLSFRNAFQEPHHLSDAWGKSRWGRRVPSAQLRGAFGQGSLDPLLCPAPSAHPHRGPPKRPRQGSLTALCLLSSHQQVRPGWEVVSEGPGSSLGHPCSEHQQRPHFHRLIPPSTLGNASTREMQPREYPLLGPKLAPRPEHAHLGF